MRDEDLHACFDHELAPGERARIERLVASDPEAAARLRGIEAVDRALELLDGCEASGDFTARVRERVRRHRRGRLLRLAAPAAAAAAILVAVLFAFRGTGDPSAPPVFSARDYLDYAWEADRETYDSLSLHDLEDLVLDEFETT